MISILSKSGRRKATLLPTEEGADVSYYRGFQSSDGIRWSLDHRAEMRGIPFHRCLEVAQGIVNNGTYRIRRV